MPNPKRFNANTLVNVLLTEAKKDYRAQKYKEYSEMRELLMEQSNNERVTPDSGDDVIDDTVTSRTVAADVTQTDHGTSVDKNVHS